jgi:hypothetical protein
MILFLPGESVTLFANYGKVPTLHRLMQAKCIPGRPLEQNKCDGARLSFTHVERHS